MPEGKRLCINDVAKTTIPQTLLLTLEARKPATEGRDRERGSIIYNVCHHLNLLALVTGLNLPRHVTWLWLELARLRCIYFFYLLTFLVVLYLYQTHPDCLQTPLPDRLSYLSTPPDLVFFPTGLFDSGPYFPVSFQVPRRHSQLLCVHRCNSHIRWAAPPRLPSLGLRSPPKHCCSLFSL